MMATNGTSQQHIVATGTNRQSEFGAMVSRSAETAISAAAAQAESQVRAMYAMALQRPRDMMAVREKLLAECQRKGFAETAEYSLPRGGKKIKGPSVRFAEVAARALTNVHVRTTITYDDAERRLGEVTAVDLESNLPLSSSFSIDKTVERKSLRGGEIVVGERTNSQGETVYRVIGTEADVQMKQEATVARIRRNLILQLLPGDIRDEALEACRQTMRRSDADDPAGTAKKLADTFRGIGITAAQLNDYLGHPVDRVTPEEAADLRGLYASLASRESSWEEVMETKEAHSKMSSEERDERKALTKRISAFRVKDAAAYAGAFKACGIKVNATSQLPTESLQKLVAYIDDFEAKAAGVAEDADADAEREPGQEG